MKSNVKRNTIRAVVVTTLLALTAGCFLRSISGIVFVDDLGTFIDLSFDNVSVARCDEFFDNTNCLYHLETEDGFGQVVSTMSLISDFGLLGVLIDPVIVQVPQDAVVVTATMNNGAGPRDLVVSETNTFNVQTNEMATAEAGHKFWIVELPEDVAQSLPTGDPANAPSMDFDFAYRTFSPPTGLTVPVKMIFAGKVDVGGSTFYPPLYPCTANFADVPAINLPIGQPLEQGFIFNLLFLMFDHLDDACSNATYQFEPIASTPMMCDADADLDVDRNDISAIFGARNSPANGPDDPRDADGDGTITVLDGRQCVASCTRPGCAVQ